jgi:hypothetical protein
MLLPVLEERKWGYINEAGEKVISCQYEHADEFFEGLARVRMNKKFGYITPSGEQVIDFAFKMSKEFHEGFASITVGDKEGYINTKGEIVIEPIYKLANTFGEGLAHVKSAEKDIWGFIDSNGKTVIDFQYKNIMVVDSIYNPNAFNEGYACVGLEDPLAKYSPMGYIDKIVRWIIEPQYSICSPFENGIAIVKVAGKNGFINHTGEYIVKPQYEGITLGFSEGIAFVKINEYYGGINLGNEIVIEPRYEFALKFQEGLAAVRVNGRWGYINKNQEFVIEPFLINPGMFRNGIASVRLKRDKQLSDKEANKDYHWGYMNRNGKILWKSE